MVDTSPVEHLRRARDWAAVHRAMVTVEPYAGITVLVENLTAMGQRIAIVTNSPRSVPLQFSDRQGWPVECIIGFHDARHRKPHPDSLLLALNRCGETAAGSFHVGDRAQDTEAARAAGMVAIGAGWGTQEMDLLLRSQPDHSFTSVDDLSDFLLSAIT